MNTFKKFIDFDGVIYDTEKRIVQQKKAVCNLSWDEFFERLDWYQLLEEAKVINDAINIILNAQCKCNDIAILTKVHTLLEAEAKIMKLRGAKVEIPVLFVPPHIKKSEVYCPKNGEILIDDSVKNLIDWENAGGKGVLFDGDECENTDFSKIRTLNKII